MRPSSPKENVADINNIFPAGRVYESTAEDWFAAHAILKSNESHVRRNKYIPVSVLRYAFHRTSVICTVNFETPGYDTAPSLYWYKKMTYLPFRQLLLEVFLHSLESILVRAFSGKCKQRVFPRIFCPYHCINLEVHEQIRC